MRDVPQILGLIIMQQNEIKPHRIYKSSLLTENKMD